MWFTPGFLLRSQRDHAARSRGPTRLDVVLAVREVGELLAQLAGKNVDDLPTPMRLIMRSRHLSLLACSCVRSWNSWPSHSTTATGRPWLKAGNEDCEVHFTDVGNDEV